MQEAMIYKAMTSAMADIGAVSKAQTNQQQHFRYRGIDDAMNALYPVLAKHGLFLVPEVLEQTREERVTKSGGNLIYSILKVRYTMYAGDGSSVSAVVIGEGMDSADKSSNKAIAAAMKYAIFQMFCIPTEDMRNDDPDKVTPPDSTPKGMNDMAQQPDFICADCGQEIEGVTTANGSKYTAQSIAENTRNKYKRCLCWNCSVKAKGSAA